MPAISNPPLPALSVVTTTDPAAGHLPELLRRLSTLAIERSELFEVVVVDDLKLWSDLSQIRLADHPGLLLRPLWYPEHRGQLAAMLAGIGLASSTRIYTTDPDMFSCVSELPAMLDQLGDDVAVLHGVRPRRLDAALPRRCGSWLANGMVRAIAGLQVADLGSPVALLRPALVQPLLADAAQLRNPRLYLYARLGVALRSYSLASGTPAGSPSQYQLLTLMKLFFRLIRESMEVRHKLNTLTAKANP